MLKSIETPDNMRAPRITASGRLPVSAWSMTIMPTAGYRTSEQQRFVRDIKYSITLVKIRSLLYTYRSDVIDTVEFLDHCVPTPRGNQVWTRD